MYRLDGRLVVSPQDLLGFLACPHLTTLSLAATVEIATDATDPADLRRADLAKSRTPDRNS